MRKPLVSFLSLGLILASCAFPARTPTPAPITEDPLQTAWEDRALFKEGLVASEQSVLDGLEGASVYHIEFNIKPEMYLVDGHQEVRYTNNESVALDQVQFRLFPNFLGREMAVSNILVDEKSVTPQYELNNSLLIVPLDPPLQPGDAATISMDFDITVPQSPSTNYGVLAYYKDVLALAHAYPMICVFDDEGWNAELPPPSGDVTYGDTSFYIVKVSAPKDLTVVATGRELSRSEEDQTQVLYFANGPARDFYLVASTLYEKISETFGDVTINSYAKDGSENGAQRALVVASKAIDVFSRRYAPYPYTELDIVATPTEALGIEYPGMIAITSSIYNVRSDSPGDRSSVYMEFTVAHEVGHQWFYGLVGDDQLDDPWLDESLTQFATLQYYEDQYGPQGAADFRDSLEGRWEEVGKADIPIGLPVAGYSEREYGAIVYGRGALFFVALKEKMGAEKFDTFLKEYTQSLAWGIATPEYLQSLAEEHCACDLDEIFNEWVYPN